MVGGVRVEIISMSDDEFNEMFPPPKIVGKSSEQEQIDEISRNLSEVLSIVSSVVSRIGYKDDGISDALSSLLESIKSMSNEQDGGGSSQ